MTETTPAATCVWPGCNSPRALFDDLPLDASPVCSVHLQVARVLADRLEAEVLRSRGIVRQSLQPAPAARSAPEPQAGVVYFVQVGGHIKIGWTTSLDRRMRSYPPGSALLLVHPGTRADESQLHRRFAAHRTHGREWYSLAADLVRHIERGKAEHGAPPAVSFAGKPATVPMPYRTQQAARPRSRVRHRS